MTRNRSPRLWHFTCSHGRAGISATGQLTPGPYHVPGLGQVLWLTDDANASRHDLGLTSTTLSCDRMGFLYRTQGPHRAARWFDVRHCIPTALRNDLEAGRDWSTWWISHHPIRASLWADWEGAA